MKCIYLAKITTPIGTLLSGVTENGICLLEYQEENRHVQQLSKLKSQLNAGTKNQKHHYHELLQTQLDDYFKRSRQIFELPIILTGSSFQKAVWRELQKIPYGETRSYREQSKALNNPGAIRAVGRANGENHIAIVVPCHRVIGADGSLTGYGGGIWRKRYLINHEKDPAGRLFS